MEETECTPSKANRLRLTAAELRLRGSSSSHPGLRLILLTLADAYERAAAFLESRRRRRPGGGRLQ
jgi:hypothetical protein